MQAALLKEEKKSIRDLRSCFLLFARAAVSLVLVILYIVFKGALYLHANCLAFGISSTRLVPGQLYFSRNGVDGFNTARRSLLREDLGESN